MLTRRAELPRSAFQPKKPPRAGRPEWKAIDDFLRWLRKLPCACQGANDWCHGPTEAAHVDYAAKGTPDAKGLGSKVSDRCAIPLSRGCHRQQTEVLGWPEFEKTLPTGDAEALSVAYFRAWPGRADYDRNRAAREAVLA